ncbi:MAG: DNA translocase FtsK [Tepidisphaerales bacterium]
MASKPATSDPIELEPDSSEAAVRRRRTIVRLCLLSLGVATWLFVLLACASFRATDWPSHHVYPHGPVQNLCGPVGAWVAYHLLLLIGQGIYPILLFTGVCLALLAVRGSVSDLWLRTAGLMLLSVAFAAALHQLKPGSSNGFPEGNGGLLGIATAKFLHAYFNTAGTMLILLTAFLIGLLLAADDLVLRAPGVAAAALEKVQRQGERWSSGGGWSWPWPLRREYAVKAAGAPAARASDEPPTDDRRILLKRHNLDESEVQLTYDHDDTPAEADAGRPGAAETASRERWADEPPSEEAVIPDAPPPRQAVLNGGTGHSTSGTSPLPSSMVLPPESVDSAPGEAGTTATTATPAPEVAAGPAAPGEHTARGGGEMVIRSSATARAKEPAGGSPPPPRELGDYQLPPWDFLAEAEHGFAEAQEKYVREKAAVLEQALREFGIDARVVAIDTGPVITMYELSLPTGMKVAAITQLSNDMARALKATSVRIVAPVPGKDTVGIEVPNPTKEKVRLKELFQLAPDAPKKMGIPIYLGKDASGEALVTDLTKMPHCLIAGTTGSGKSVCVNTIVMSILYHQRPDHVKMILIDPKVVELKPFESIPHLMCPPINDPNKAPSVLEWLCTKMDERYELLAEAGVRQIGDYNRLTREQLNEIFQPATPEEEAKIPKFLPYIVVIIDELADLMMMSGDEVEKSIVRLAQKSRAVGIHVILATQRPSAKVVTGLIKSNMPSRIAFRVQSRMDSRIVLDQNGAELLLGQGDMLFLPNGASKPIRAQGTFIDDLEVRQSVKLVRERAEAHYEPELVQIRQLRSDEEFEHDELYEDAVRIVIETKRGSVSLLQRRLSIGYARASRLIERMAATGILGDYKGSQSREVLLTMEEWEAAKAQMAKDKAEGMTV